ncbi:MAG: hypothetical protein A3I68_03130 [Candidatus Melainabacteria bacterium RIFCSPLOWO2_02_FULL_35_15]|nr:MAG: hypothetical protein A3I68_03130 [Candidatus Melainabacteria bacterium RIFCSPLOWO2_02_FULL_35_15]
MKIELLSNNRYAAGNREIILRITPPEGKTLRLSADTEIIRAEEGFSDLRLISPKGPSGKSSSPWILVQLTEEQTPA